MKSKSFTLFIACAVVFVMGCSHAPRMVRPSGDLDTYRTEFFRNNPDGKHNQQIQKGEVAKGMDVFEVLASWGLPNLRKGAQQSNTESWVYYTVDEHSKKVISYELIFVSDELSRWVIDKKVAGQGILTPEDLIGFGTSSQESVGRITTSEPGTKKR